MAHLPNSQSADIRRVTMAKCVNAGCAWTPIRFPLRGVRGGEAFVLLCPGCGESMELSLGEPHPHIMRQQLIEEIETGGGVGGSS